MAYQEGTGSTLEQALNDAIQKAKAGTQDPIQWKLIDIKGESGGANLFSVRIDFHFSSKGSEKK